MCKKKKKKWYVFEAASQKSSVSKRNLRLITLWGPEARVSPRFISLTLNDSLSIYCGIEPVKKLIIICRVMSHRAEWHFNEIASSGSETALLGKVNGDDVKCTQKAVLCIFLVSVYLFTPVTWFCASLYQSCQYCNNLQQQCRQSFL